MMVKLTGRLLIKLFRVAVLLLVVAVIALGAVLLNPQWVSPILETELAKQGVQADVSKLSAEVDGTTYQLQSTLSATAVEYGVDLSSAEVRAAIDWWALLTRQPFVEVVAVESATATLNSDILKSHFQQSTTQSMSFARYLPKTWRIEKTKVTVDEQTLQINAIGHQDTQLTATVVDAESGQLSLSYDKASQQVQVNSEQLNVKAFTGYDATLKQLQATIHLNDWFNSEVKTQLLYEGLDSTLSITGENNGVVIHAQSADKSLQLRAERTADGDVIRFNEADLSIFQLIQPWLPTNIPVTGVTGLASGKIVYVQGRGVVLADVVLSNAGVQHEVATLGDIDAALTYKNKILRYQLKLADSLVVLPTVFPWKANHFSGHASGSFDWRKQTLNIAALSLKNKDIETLSAKGSVQLASEPELDLSGQITNVNLAKTKTYLPAQTPPYTKRWLGQALVSGRNNETQFELRGKASELLTPKATFKIDVTANDSVLRYSTRNPPLDIGQAQLAFRGASLSISSDDATLEGLPVVADVQIADLLNAVIDIKASMANQAADKMIAVAKKSLAAKTVKQVEQLVEVEGQFNLDLGIMLDLANMKNPDTFDIRLSASKASATLKDYPNLPIKQLVIDVAATQDGLSRIDGKGKLYGEAIDFQILGPDRVIVASKKQKTKKNQQPAGYSVAINTVADALPALTGLALLTQREAAVLKKYQMVRGKSAYQVGIEFDESGELLDVDVRSRLKGTAIKAFGLADKPATSNGAFSLHYAAKKRHLTASLANAWTIEAGLLGQGAVTGLLLNNTAAKHSYQPKKLQAYWRAKQFDYPRFEAFKTAWSQAQSINNDKQTTSPLLSAYAVDIDIAQMQFDGKQRYPVTVKGTQDNLSINSPLLTGKIQYRPNHLSAQIQQIAVEKLFNLVKQTEVNPEGREVATVDLAKALPQMNIQVEKVLFRGSVIGNANIQTSIRSGRYSIDQLLLTGNSYFCEVSGYEAKEPQGITTKIQADFKGENLRSVIKTFKLNDVIDAKYLDASVNLSWPGKAHTLNLRQSYGKGKMSAQNLKLLNMNSGVGSVFGLMDIGSILRRISLDFKNLTSSKVSFDTVSGSWNIGGGRAMTRDYYADGSVIALKVKGATDLHRREFDNIALTVIPRASNIFPIIGAVAGGVVGGAAGLVVQQALGDNIDEAVGLPYRLSGTWAAPVVNFKGTTTEAGDSSRGGYGDK